jgi:hypothetical protein
MVSYMMRMVANCGLREFAAIMIYCWNTKHLGQAVNHRKSEGLDSPTDLLGGC